MEEQIKTFTVRIGESLWRRLKIQAINRGTTLAAVVERALEEAAPAGPELEQDDLDVTQHPEAV